MEEKRVEDVIVETSLELFTKNGIKDVSMDDVAQALGMSKRTLYTYFNSKGALLVRCIEHLHDSRHRSFDKMINSGMNFIEMILKCFFEAVMYLKTINPVFLSDLRKSNFSVAQDVLNTKMHTTQMQLAALIERGKAEGLITPLVDSQMLAAMMNSHPPMNRPITLGDGKSWEMSDVMKQVSIIFLRGIATEKGLQMIDTFLEENKDILKKNE